MNKLNLFSLLILLCTGFLILQSCDKDDDPDPITEFIADDDTFAGWDSWPLEATFEGEDPALGGAHGGMNEETTRNVYFKGGQDLVDGEYPIGTVIVKHSSTPDGTIDEYTAMVKRGNDFNTANNDWEWFMLGADSKMRTDDEGNQVRGANLMDGACGSCHSLPNATDFVFSK